VYASAEYRAMLPNAFLTRVIGNLMPGHALDVCTGEGRNAVYLASRGWQVTGFDVAERGLALARAKAERAGAALSVVRSTEAAFVYGRDVWDLIVISYAPVEVTQPAFVAKLRRALRSGGSIVIESFAFDSRLGPTRLGALEIDTEQLLHAFREFTVEAYETIETVPDWGMCAAPIVRLFAHAA
jgi:SAM-dependent methyltransferase